jgi:tRNA(adenine34) deaminase
MRPGSSSGSSREHSALGSRTCRVLPTTRDEYAHPVVGGNDQILVAWSKLGPIWHEAFRLAWEALGQGTVPVGAVLVDDAGIICARGRNRIYDPNPSNRRISGSRLAHAEVDALIDLDPEGWYTSYSLYSILEPCLLCVGATIMSTVGRLLYAGRDPYGGADGALTGVNAHVERVPLRLEGPLDGPFGRLATLLHVAFYLNRKPQGHVVAAHQRTLPDLVAAANSLLRSGVLDAASNGERLDDYLARTPERFLVEGQAGSREQSRAPACPGGNDRSGPKPRDRS